MKKGKSILSLILVIAVTALFGMTCVLGLDLKGKSYTSVEFAQKIDKILPMNSNITFIIGGSLGLNEVIRDTCDELISFSTMTFPHRLFRGILLEQIYRTCKINNHEMYHK